MSDILTPDLGPQDTASEPAMAPLPRYRKHLAKYWWLWGFVLILIVAWGVQRWNQRLTPFEQRVVGVWHSTAGTGGQTYEQYVVISPDRTTDIWSLDQQGEPVGIAGWEWKADASQISVRDDPDFTWRSPIVRSTWDRYPIVQHSPDQIEFQKFSWQRVGALPEPFAAARKKWLREGSVD